MQIVTLFGGFIIVILSIVVNFVISKRHHYYPISQIQNPCDICVRLATCSQIRKKKKRLSHDKRFLLL